MRCLQECIAGLEREKAAIAHERDEAGTLLVSFRAPSCSMMSNLDPCSSSP